MTVALAPLQHAILRELLPFAIDAAPLGDPHCDGHSCDGHTHTHSSTHGHGHGRQQHGHGHEHDSKNDQLPNV